MSKLETCVAQWCGPRAPFQGKRSTVDCQQGSLCATGSCQSLSATSGTLQQTEMQLEVANAEQALFTQVLLLLPTWPARWHTLGCFASMPMRGIQPGVNHLQLELMQECPQTLGSEMKPRGTDNMPACASAIQTLEVVCLLTHLQATQLKVIGLGVRGVSSANKLAGTWG